MVGAELEEDVGAGRILEEVVEAHDVAVPQRPVDPHLRLQLLVGWLVRFEGGGVREGGEGKEASQLYRFLTSSYVYIHTPSLLPPPFPYNHTRRAFCLARLLTREDFCTILRANASPVSRHVAQ